MCDGVGGIEAGWKCSREKLETCENDGWFVGVDYGRLIKRNNEENDYSFEVSKAENS